MIFCEKHRGKWEREEGGKGLSGWLTTKEERRSPPDEEGVCTWVGDVCVVCMGLGKKGERDGAGKSRSCLAGTERLLFSKGCVGV